jgi:serine/threonine protein kinase/tetratricopeptide (TPR) repeat protein
MLRGALGESFESATASSEPASGEAPPEPETQRFEHYELVKGEDGKPVQLGRGGMGVTYKAFDIDLRCPVALKVISARYLHDESARLRFVREARAAASVRHPNVASVFHLGRSGEDYFYAMEFVDGETLDNLIKRSGRLETKLALEIATQVAAGLAAVHKQKLVHRDIKPTNIMVSLEEGGAVTAKIIDLGLAKAVNEARSQTAISMPGAFAGTPEFASPEQFAGVGVDIRSDLYSLGVTLWEMMTGQPPFQGSPAEVMYRHQHARLPLEQLEGVPQPVAVLLEALLEKDPVRRFQNPTGLLKVMPMITNAVDSRRRITRQKLQQMTPADSRVRTGWSPAAQGPKKISIARLPITGSNVFGREEDIALLDAAWANRQVNVVTIVAWAGLGKSTLVNRWLGQMAAEHYRSAELVFGWSFCRQGTSGQSSSADEFLEAALAWFGDPDYGDIRCRKEVSERLAHDVRQGIHARKAMESYQTWFGEGPELSVLCMLGLFDRPADQRAFGALLSPPAIRGLTESLTDLNPTEWRTILARLRRARLLAGEDPHNPGYLDTHPLVREYFGAQLRGQRTDAWKECNRRLYNHYRTLAPQLPDSFREMEPLFLAVTCGCNAGLFREALHQVYIPRIQRGSAGFATNVLGARGALLSVLAHFFEHGRWGSPVQTGVGGQSLTEEDQLFILMQAARNLTALRESAPEAKNCYQRAESLCHSLNRPVPLYVALMGQWRYSMVAGTLAAAMPLAKRVYSLAQDQNVPTLLIGACSAMGATYYYSGDFGTARQYTTRALQIWRAGGVRSPFQEVDAQPVACLSHEALLEWHFGEIPSCRATAAEAISLAKELHDMHGLAVALWYAAVLGSFERNVAEVECLASELIELSTRQHFAHWLAAGVVCRGWARSASGDTAEGIAWIEEGIGDYRALGSILFLPFFLALKAEALHRADRSPEALEAIREAEALVKRFEGRCWLVELHRLRGVFLASMGSSETEIEACFREAIRTAKQQKSISLAARAEASYAEFRCRKKLRP